MKRKRSHTTSDRAKIFAQVISQQQPDAVAPSEKNIAEMLKGLSFTIGRKDKQTNGKYDKTSDDGKH